MDTNLIRFTGPIARITFDKERKLKPTHGAISRMLVAVSRDLQRPVSISELMGDVFVGQRYLLQALLQPGLAKNENLTLDKVSDLIEAFREAGGKVSDLQTAIGLVLADYLGFEMAKDDEDEDDHPNEQAPAASGNSGGAE